VSAPVRPPRKAPVARPISPPHSQGNDDKNDDNDDISNEDIDLPGEDDDTEAVEDDEFISNECSTSQLRMWTTMRCPQAMRMLIETAPASNDDPKAV
jgi:hypothetical protein